MLTAVVAETALPVDNEANTDGNTHFYGFESENLGDGKDPWPEVQVDAMVRVSAAICRAHGWKERSVIGHLEWQPGKVDPRTSPGGADVSMPKTRTRIAERLKHPASWSPAKPSTPAPAPPKPVPAPTIEQRLSALEKTVTAQGKRIAALEQK